MVTPTPYIIMPVKDSYETTEQAVRAIVDSGHTMTIYNDYSTPENTAKLQALADELGIRIVHIAEHVEHPSPNYRWVLIEAQQEALRRETHLVIVESDVVVKRDTIASMLRHVGNRTGMVAAVTHDTKGEINFPYEYARKLHGEVVDTRKRLSFCCTLISHNLLRAYDFSNLDPEKNWYDVTISHKSLELGYVNRLLRYTSVTHMPHSSRPWKQLKYTNPLLYYWRKLTQKKDRI